MRGLLVPLLWVASQGCSSIYEAPAPALDPGDGGADPLDASSDDADSGGCERVTIDESFLEGTFPGSPWSVENQVSFLPGRPSISADSPDNSDHYSILAYGGLAVQDVTFEVELVEAFVESSDTEVGLVLIRSDLAFYHTIYLHNLSRVSQRAALEEEGTDWEPCHPTTGCQALGSSVTEENRLILRLETDDAAVTTSFRLGNGPTVNLSNTPILDPDATVELWAFARSRAAGSIASMVVRRFSLSGCPGSG